MKRFFYAILSVILASSTAFAQTNHTVSVGGASLAFSPSSLTIDQGDSVTWTNAGGFHNVNGSQATYSMNPVGFSNGGASSSSWTYGFRFNTPGTYNYQCDPHAGGGMVATITVNAVSMAPPIYDIATVSTEDMNGVADSLSVACELRGLVYSEDFRGGNGVQFYMKDNTGGINVFNFNDVSGYQVNVGDSIHVVGSIDQFNGLIEIIPDSIALISSGNSIGLPEITTTIDDSNEGNYIKLQKVYLLDTTQWTNSGSGFNVQVSNGTDTFVVRLDDESFGYNLQAPRPTDTLNFSGAASQFDGSGSPFNTGWQLLPSTVDDVVLLNSECLPVYPIATVHKEDATSGVADSLGVACELRGVVTSVDYDGNNGISFYIADNTGAINIFNFNDVSAYTVTLGDSIHAVGAIAQFNGLVELIPDSIELISQGNSFDTTVVTSFGESNESFLATIEGYSIVDIAQWPTSSDNVQFTNGTDTIIVRIDSDTDILGNAPPMAGVVYNITGIINQFDGNAPFLEGYQILPRFHTDIAPATVPPPPPATPVYSIAEVHGEDMDGVADSLNVTCELRGVVHSVDYDGNAGYSFFMADTSGFINVFNFNDVSGYTVSMGDSIHVIGNIAQFNGLTEIIPDSILLVSSGNTLRAPEVVNSFGEENESFLVTIEGFSIVDTVQWPAPGDNGNVEFTNGTVTLTVRVDRDTDVDELPAPALTDSLNITGIITQFDSSNPFLEAYQLLPRMQSDVVIIATNSEPNFELDLRVYPNPAQNLLVVELEDSRMERVQLLDMMGRSVKVMEAKQSRLTLNVSDLNEGIYNLVVETAAGKAVRKVVIRK
ncbi:MAG: plastocyanin/azurin family copper-binding protein [Bacteroidia bacterium]|nr:plastocyanin/azurin family copper-binding protein [Bacteroidia bacterium]